MRFSIINLGSVFQWTAAQGLFTDSSALMQRRRNERPVTTQCTDLIITAVVAEVSRRYHYL